MIQNTAVTDRWQTLFRERRRDHGGVSAYLAEMYVCTVEGYFESENDSFVTIAEFFQQ